MIEKNYDFQARLLNVHKKDRRIRKPLGNGQIEITEKWSIVSPEGNEFLASRALDLTDYLSVSMGVELGASDSAEGVIEYAVDPSMEKNGSYRVEVSPTLIRLIGKDERAAARAGYLLEDMMNLECAPYLNIGVTHRAPTYRCRMIHSGYAEDDYPDGYLNAAAHSGINTILVYVKGINKTPMHELDFNDLIDRAAKFGLDVYVYSYLRSRMHPEDEGAEEFYDSLYGELFRKCPGFKGIVFVGESVEFPSKDRRTSGMLRLDNIGPDGKKIVDKPNPGWFPCRDYPLWLDMVKKTIRRERPDADIVFWTYNWGYCDEKDRIALIDALPTDISLQATFEMFENGERDGVPTRSTDYTISFPEAGKYFLSEADAAARNGIPFYSMTNSGGLTWDTGVVPYEPAPYLWLRRYEAMRECAKKYGLCGSMDSHHYGFYPSFISDLAKEFFDSPDADGEAILEKLILRDWGEENLGAVKEAYRLFSDGIEGIITSNKDQYGPLRVGPAYPLVLFRDEDIVLWGNPKAHHRGNAICKPKYNMKRDLSDPKQVEIFMGEARVFKNCADRMLRGAEILKALLPTLHESKRENAARIAGVGEFMGRTFLTTHHLKLWYMEKFIISHDPDELSTHLDKLLRIGAMEIENVKATLPLVDRDSRLGFEPSMDYVGDRAHLEWKLKLTESILNEEIPRLREKA